MVPVAVFVILYLYLQRDEDALIPPIIIQAFLLLTSSWFFYLVYMYMFAKRYSNPAQIQQIDDARQKDSQRFALPSFENLEGARDKQRDDYGSAINGYPRTDALGAHSYDYAERIVGNYNDIFSRNNKPIHKS